MTTKATSRLQRFARWLFGSPFRQLPPAFGNTIPSDLQVFEAQANEAAHQGLGGTAAPASAQHRKTHPERQETWMERQ